MTPITASMRGDATAVVERMAGWLRSDGAPHPGAGALVLAVRGHLQMTQDEFADELGLPLGRIDALERGCVPIGALPPQIGERLATIPDIDVIAICDLERTAQGQLPTSREDAGVSDQETCPHGSHRS